VFPRRWPARRAAVLHGRDSAVRRTPRAQCGVTGAYGVPRPSIRSATPSVITTISLLFNISICLYKSLIKGPPPSTAGACVRVGVRVCERVGVGVRMCACVRVRVRVRVCERVCERVNVCQCD